MAVQSSTSRVQYQGNGSSVTPYPVPFYFFENANIRVFILPDGGSEVELIGGTDYQVTGAGDPNGGEMVTTLAYPSDTLVTIVRDLVPTQETIYDENDKFPAKTHERGLDKLTMLVQQVFRAVDRSIRFTDSYPAAGAFAPAFNTVLGISGSGTARSFNQSELLTWLNLTIPGIIGQPTMTFADSGERAIAAPEFIGQVGAQRDDSSIWISTGLTAGDWTIIFESGMLIIPDDSILPAKLAQTFDASALLDFVLPGASIGGRDAATSLINADEFLFRDSVAGDLKKITRENLRNSLLPAGSVLQTFYQEFKTATTISTVIPFDDTIPQITEGEQVFSQAITPSSTSSKILVEWQIWAARNSTVLCLITALFRNGASDAIAALSSNLGSSAQVPGQTCGFFLDSPNSTSAQTYTLRVGPNNNTFQLNGTGLGRIFGGSGVCTFKVTEIKG